MSEQNLEMGERRRRREEERRRLAGELVEPVGPSAQPAAPASPPPSRRELRERAAAAAAASASPTSTPTPPPAAPPVASPAAPTWQAQQSRPAPVRPAPVAQQPVQAPVAQQAVQAPVAQQPVQAPVQAPTPEPRSSRRDLRERAAELRQQAEAGHRPDAARPAAPAAPAPLVEPVVVKAALKPPVVSAPQVPAAVSPLSPQARATAIRAQAARAQAEREEAARVQLERAHSQRDAQQRPAAPQRPAAQPPSNGWTQQPTAGQQAGPGPAQGSRHPAAPEAELVGPRPFLTGSAAASAVHSPAQPPQTARPIARAQIPVPDPASAVRRVVLPPMEVDPDAIPVPELRAGTVAPTGRANAWTQDGDDLEAGPAPTRAPAAVPGVTPDGVYKPVISPARPAVLRATSPGVAGANGVAGSNGASATSVSRRPAFTPAADTSSGAAVLPDRDAAATAVQSFPRIAPSGPAFAPAGGTAAPAAIPATRPDTDVSSDVDLPRWGSLGWTPAPAGGAVVDTDTDTDTGTGFSSGFGTNRGFGIGSDARTSRPEPEPTHDPDEESAHHPYTWLHMIVLVVVAFILGMLIFMVVMQDDATNTGAVADTHEIVAVADGGAGA